MKTIRMLVRAIALASVLMTQACASVEYSAEPIEAWVVDAGTNEPLEGVVVVADWVLEGGISVNNFTKVNRVGDLVVMEAVTEKNGRFSFPAWGPKRTTEGILDDKDPRLLIFKSGYEYVEVDNSLYFSRHFSAESKPQGPLRKSFWSGETIKLKKFRGSMREYSSHLHVMPLGSLVENCGWRNIPHLLIAISRQSDAFRSNGVPELYSIDRYIPTNISKCGSPQEFFRNYKP